MTITLWQHLRAIPRGRRAPSRGNPPDGCRMSTNARDRWRLPGPVTLSRNWRREMTNELERLLTITDLSEMLGVPVDTLWRHRGEGPAGYRIGRHVRYRRATVEGWL